MRKKTTKVPDAKEPMRMELSFTLPEYMELTLALAQRAAGYVNEFHAVLAEPQKSFDREIGVINALDRVSALQVHIRGRIACMREAEGKGGAACLG